MDAPDFLKDAPAAAPDDRVANRPTRVWTPDDRTPFVDAQTFAREKCEHMIPIHELTLLIHKSNAVRIPIKRDPNVCLLMLHFSLQIFQCLGLNGICFMMGEGAVWFKIE